MDDVRKMLRNKIIRIVNNFLLIYIVTIVFIFISSLVYHRAVLRSLKQKHELSIRKEREEAVKRSKNTIRGNISEEFTPLFPSFPYTMSDCKFLGAPIDYIVFENMSSYRDGTDVKINIVFADVKEGSSQTTKVQKGIQEAIVEGRCRWETWRINKEKHLNIKPYKNN